MELRGRYKQDQFAKCPEQIHSELERWLSNKEFVGGIFAEELRFIPSTPKVVHNCP